MRSKHGADYRFAYRSRREAMIVIIELKTVKAIIILCEGETREFSVKAWQRWMLADVWRSPKIPPPVVEAGV